MSTPQKSEGERMREIGESLGWTDIHGGPEDGGAYWRGTPPGSKRVIACPDWLSMVWQVIGEHNRHGEWIAGTYDNPEAAKQHFAFLDATKDGWNNLCGGEIREVVVASGFVEPTNQPSAMGGSEL